MRILLTGADGFIGRRTAPRVLEALSPDELVLADQKFRERLTDTRVVYVEGSLAERDVMEHVMSRHFDLIFHFAAIPGGWAEEDFKRGMDINLLATMAMLERIRAQGKAPVFLYSSSIGVYGELPQLVDDSTPARPNWSYGTHKAMGEMLVVDYTRKGWIDGRILRFPGVVARPADPSGAISAFLSDLIRCVANGENFVCPVSPKASSWWMSRECCIDNVLIGAQLPAARLDFYRTWLLPPLRATFGEVVDALAKVYGVDARSLVRYEPIEEVEARFGRLPPVRCPHAEALGFHNDGSIEDLVRRALI